MTVRSVWHWLRDGVKGVLSVLDVVVDYVYDRADLWQNKAHGIADHAKVRSFLLYSIVGFVYLTLALRVAFGYSALVSTTYLLYMGWALLALSAGERVLLAFFKMMSGRLNQVDPTVDQG